MQTAVDPNDGTLYAVFSDVTDFDSSTGNYDVDIYFTKSDDSGLTWSDPPTILNSDSTIPADQFMPWIEVDSFGRIHVVYYDTRSQLQSDDGLTPAIAEVYYAFSDDGGDNWTDFPISPQPFEIPDDASPLRTRIGDYIGIAVNNRTVHPIYMSTHEGAAHIYSNKILPCLLGDVNGDGAANLLDISPFVDIQSQGGFSCEADINGDGDVNLLDVVPFIEVISN